MVLDKLGSSLKDTLKKIAKAVFVDEKLVNELVKDIQRALISADVNVKLVFELSNKIKQRALKEEIKGITKREHLVNIVYEELVNFLGEDKAEIKVTKKKPFKIMMVGLFGSGKTTTISKLAKYYTKRGYKVASLGLDVHRPAAPDQLKQISEQVKIDCYIDKKEKNPLKIYEKYEKDFKKYDILLIDTSGRDALSEDLIEEIEKLTSKIKPDERLLVLSADIGQAALGQAEQFHKSCDITSVIVTKLDGTAKGGGALSACSATGANVKFIGVGEKPDDLEIFNPKGFVSRLLGMGDLEALLEKAKDAISEEDAKDMGKKFQEGDFDLEDLYEQMKAMSKMGPLSKVMDMIPGFGQVKLPKDALKVQEGKLKKWKFVIDSMTKEEKKHPDVLDISRIERIAKGAGVKVSDVRELLKQYRQSKKLIKMMGGEQDPNKLMKKFQGKIPKGFNLG
ncbi:signal recognition particle protein Srp54 [archaeon]|nr:signal recognition particle protein Srp54 [archaeon]